MEVTEEMEVVEEVKWVDDEGVEGGEGRRHVKNA